MGIIRLESMEFWAYHGVFKSEKEKGNKFQVDVSIDFSFEDNLEDKLGNTIDYGEVYELVKKEMSSSSDLIEQVALDIAGSIKGSFPMINGVVVKVSKFNPPIAGDLKCASVEVRL